MKDETETLKYEGEDGYLKLIAIIAKLSEQGYTTLTLSKEELETDKECVVITLGKG